MNCIIVDDDKLSRKVLTEFVNRTENLVLIDTFESAVQAINSLKKIKDKLDLVFLDIEMPDMSGMEFLQNLKTYPQIIIASSKEKYALEAFEYDVTDYLLKPISYSRFFKSVTKAIKKEQESISFNNSSNGIKLDDEIFIKKNSTLIKLKYEDIFYIEALENYITVNSIDDKYTIHFTMKAIESKLPSDFFKRVHRSFIVNIKNIKGIEDNSVIIKLKNTTKLIPIGKSYKENLMDELNLITK